MFFMLRQWLIIILQLPYTWNIESNNGIALKKPELDIPESGWVPSHVQVFRLKLHCTGVVNAEVRVQLILNITAVNRKHGDVSLVFRRNKICLKTTDMLLDSIIGNYEKYFIQCCASLKVSTPWVNPWCHYFWLVLKVYPSIILCFCYYKDFSTTLFHLTKT